MTLSAALALAALLAAEPAPAPAAAPGAAPAPATAAALAVAPGGSAAKPLPPAVADLIKRERRFAPVALAVDLAGLGNGEKQALARLVEAARLMNGLFLRQVWSGNASMLHELSSDPTPLGRLRLAVFLRNQGPWDRIDGKPFLLGVGEKSGGAGYYPEGASKAEVEKWLAGLTPADREQATGFFTVVRRAPGGAFTVVPYAQEYQAELTRAAALLREAAGLTTDPALRAFLEARAAAFTGNDYRDSDVAWMKLDGAIEPTIGPYEVYEDGWFNAKAAFEAFVGLRDEAETRKLARFSAELQGIEDALPIDASLKNAKLGGLAPIRVVNELFAAGEAARGVTTAAYNLPNDEVVVKALGSKRVMLKNVQQAKFDKVLVPIARIALAPTERPGVAFEPFFTHILMHELVHGLGPHEVAVPGGAAVSVRSRLGDAYSAIEEAKADVGGLFALQKLLDDGRLEPALGRTLYPTYLASMFRSLRFGLGEAHGKGTALQLNWFLDAGGVTVRRDGTFGADPAKLKAAVVSLTRELMTIEGKGDREAAVAILGKLGVIRPEVQRVLDRLGELPVDIAPRFVTADQLTRR